MENVKLRKKKVSLRKDIENNIPEPPTLDDFYDNLDDNVPLAPKLEDFYSDPGIETKNEIPAEMEKFGKIWRK